MKLPSIVLFGMLLVAQPALGVSDASTTTGNSDTKVLSQTAHDDFEIDFDAIDRELESLKVEEKKKEKPWWITKQLKHLGTRIMIKALLGYVAVQDFCVDTWHGTTKRVNALIALLYAKQAKKSSRAVQKQ